MRTYKNKIDTHGSADPFIVYHEGYYYYLKTTGDITIFRGKTLDDLKAESKTVYQPGNEVSANIWAPELHFIGDRWYIYSSGSVGNSDFNNIRMFCLESESEDPFGEYHFKAFMDKTIHGIDMTVLVNDENGKLYAAYSQFTGRGQVIGFAEMDNPWTISENRIELSSAELPWETKGARSDRDSRVNEGPIFLKKDGNIFLIYSASGCWSEWYCLGMIAYTGGAVMDKSSWVKSPEPVFEKGNSVYGVGHCSFFKSPDGTEDWIAYHGMDVPDAGEVGRYAYAKKFTWDNNGFPVFGEPAPRNFALPAPSGE